VRDGGGGSDEWERATPRRRGPADEDSEWEATPLRAGSGALPGSGRPDTGASTWDYLASPAPSPVRAGSRGGAGARLLP
jgi:hypothetical protein